MTSAPSRRKDESAACVILQMYVDMFVTSRKRKRERERVRVCVCVRER